MKIDDNIQQLINNLNGADEECKPIMQKLIAMGEQAIPAIIDACADKQKNVRWRAVWMLGQIKPTNQEIISALLNALDDTELAVRMYAVKMLSNILDGIENGNEIRGKAVAALEKALTDKEQWVAGSAANALIGLGELNERTKPLILKAFNREKVVKP